MTAKTSITLSVETLRALDRFIGEGGNRSRAIEQAIREFLDRRRREERDARDHAILDRSADELNREAADVLSFQVDL